MFTEQKNHKGEMELNERLIIIKRPPALCKVVEIHQLLNRGSIDGPLCWLGMVGGVVPDTAESKRG